MKNIFKKSRIFLVQKLSNFTKKIKKVSLKAKNRIQAIFTDKTKVEETTTEQKPKLILEDDNLRVVNNQVTQPTKTIITSLIVGTLLLSQLTLVLSNAQTTPDRIVYNNPESILTIELEDNRKTNTLDKLIKSLPNNSSETRRYGITNMTGVVKFNKSEHGITISGEYTKQNLKKEYNKELGSFLSKLEQVKDVEDKGTDKRVDNLKLEEQNPKGDVSGSLKIASEVNFKGEKVELKSDLARFSKWDIEATRYTYLFTDPSISSISLSGYKDVITKIKNNLENNKNLKVKTIQLIDLKEIENQVKAIQTKIEKRIKEEKELNTKNKTNKKEDPKQLEQRITQEVLAKEMETIQNLTNNTTKEELNQNQPPVELTEQKVELVNKILKEEPNKTKSYKTEDLDKLPLTTQEKSMVKQLLKDYNTIPEHKKSQLPQTLTKVSEIKENNLKTERNILEKSNTLVDGVVSGGVRSEARFYCQDRYNMRKYWWGGEFWMNNCVINIIGAIGDFGTILSAMCWMIAAFTGPAGISCWAAVVIILRIYGAYNSVLKFQNYRCGYRGANINIPWSLTAWVSSVC